MFVFTDASLSGCHYDLMLDNATGTFKTSFKVKATRDFIKDNNFVQEIAFQPIRTFENQMFNNYAPNPIMVGTCISSNNFPKTTSPNFFCNLHVALVWAN